ncbi:rod shape-determining protein RodA [Geobacter sulfurreducens]|uniref:Peptidoglycan glycosyltransferase RodA n=1 Tax=Geobacter sulfurreducens (strain ATCC 51573 / DSM 12127 / PCA) TaxID=243231 RepID=Q74BG3_GEOSL|nr:rod shape-determining protein RodA [Geobacter sulfurreducens]AAR35454.1 cell shape-determining protein RodA [Geobacter sulfurreducens PCA]UAC02805.1 rod shape-determining protein RodA [Geobacter sulfurreducens]HBB70768.1 rod shape-determining protein RodA [Geobacter sulfurreducens]HCD97644.1 rod shape-determining protein RodA [Geobacter sulfurreducens]
MIDRRLITNFDWMLLGLVLLICAVGVVNIYSASSSYVLSGTPYYLKQMSWVLVGLAIMLLVCSIDYHLLEDVAYWFYGILFLLLLVVLAFGKTSMGATRWLHLGFISVQPSEPMKIIGIITMARILANIPVSGGLGLRELAFPALMIGAPAILIMKQPDLGTAILVILIAGSMLAFVGIRLSALAAVCIATVPAVWLGWHYYLRDYQKNRVLNFLDPERDPLGTGYHIIQSKIAVGSGGLFGKGFLQGTQSQLRFLPEQHTDFAFSVFAEEWGFVGSLVVLLLYAVLTLWGLQIARRCNDRFGSLVAVGVTAMLFWHIIINIGMVIGLFPVVGVPLPLFSYGGTSMITSMTGIGILLNISMRRFMF